MLEPEEAPGGAAAALVEVGAGGVSGEGVGGLAGGGEDDVDAGVGGDLGRLDLGDHAAGADPGLARAADLDSFEVLGPVHVLDAGAGGARGVAVVEAVHVGEEDQQVGADQVGDEGGEPVVVAEADLVGGDGVVLVDDGERAEGEQLVEGAVGVAVVGAAAGVVAGEQHLAHADAVPREGGGVAGDEQALADAGGGLLAGEVAGAAREAERGEAGGDGAGGDEDDLAGAAGAGLREDVDQGVDAVGVEPS